MSVSFRSVVVLTSVLVSVISIIVYVWFSPLNCKIDNFRPDETPSKPAKSFDPEVTTSLTTHDDFTIASIRENVGDEPQLPNHHPFSSADDDETRRHFLSRFRMKKLNDIIPLTPGHKVFTVENVDAFNNKRLAPLLKSICSMEYFRFVKLNLRKPCSLWPDDGRCSERDCSIRFCDESDLPAVIVHEDDESFRKEGGDRPTGECTESNLADVNETISTEHEETMDSLFECTNDEDGQYIDLLLNPERFTGYRGESAHRVWKSIYEENCFFRKGHSHANPFSLDNVCYEERIFYRAVSGLHTSINIHLSASYPASRTVTSDRRFTHNVDEFVRRFCGRESFLLNLYFLFLLEIRALEKAEGYLLNQVNWKSSGDSIETRDAIKSLLKVVRGFKWKFNETSLFQRSESTVAQEFAAHFKNITSVIMDCVACDKCRLWGKLQMHGLGTAFKILSSTENNNNGGGGATTSMVTKTTNPRLHLTRHEITSLINAISRLSSSIVFLEDFDRLLKSSNQHLQLTSKSTTMTSSKTVPFSSRLFL